MVKSAIIEFPDILIRNRARNPMYADVGGQGAGFNNKSTSGSSSSESKS